jgi:hypothetical protein
VNIIEVLIKKGLGNLNNGMYLDKIMHLHEQSAGSGLIVN